MSSDLPNPSSPSAPEPDKGAEKPVADKSPDGVAAADETVRTDETTVRAADVETVRDGAEETVRIAGTGAEETVRMSAADDATDADATVRVTEAETVRTRIPADVSAENSGGSSVLRTVVTSFAAVWLVAALVLAAWFGTGWVRGMWFTDGPRADARDTALDAAQQAAINLTSMNPDNVEASINTMRSSMTGDMLAQLDQNHDRIKDAAEKSKTKIESKVLGGALSSLDSERDKASAIVVLKLTQTAPNVPVQSFRATWTLDMKKDGDTWKTEQANSLGQLVALDAPSPAGATPPPADGSQPAPQGAPAAPSQAPAPQPGS
ncbi:hypothetical protein NONO_c69390 [Nocardia nova SH22a]|uniref:Mce-associated membrane protein n=1 Tax=Nocardia nova SH22a TaxID=1415166 RepID=W5TRB0_9NOCA|nr:hypothetical protein [Nocardia nova]AHH21704.1 hypothetical protein NONO_c69390 [Nocardia nova SH22a]